MNKKFIAALLLGTLLLTSCSNNIEEVPTTATTSQISIETSETTSEIVKLNKIDAPHKQELSLNLRSDRYDSATLSFYTNIQDSKLFSEDDIILISEDENVATIRFYKFTNGYIDVVVDGIANGETYVYIMNSDKTISSDKIHVVVTGERPSPTPIPEGYEPESRTVYVSNSGKYHYDSNCSNITDYKTMSENEAIENGYDRCKKCT